MSFSSILSSGKELEVNLVVQIDTGSGTISIATKQPDSGLVITSDYLGLIGKVTVSPAKVDIRRSNSTVANATFTLLDRNAVISSLIGADDNLLHDRDVRIYVGFVNADTSLDFSGYQLVAQTIIRKLAKRDAFYTFTSQEPVSLIRDPIFQSFTQLSSDISDTATTITVDDTTPFSVSGGQALIEDEFFTYGGISGSDLTGVTRATLNSTAVAHSLGVDIRPTTDLSGNPIDIMLDLITGSDKLNIAGSKVDSASFTTIRDSFHATSDHDFFGVTNITDTLRFIETELTQPTMTRLITKNGKIALAQLDETDFLAVLPVINETDTNNQPGWTSDSNAIVNQVIVKYNYSEGKKLFSRTEVVDDTVSQTKFGLKRPLTYSFKGIKTASAGQTRAIEFANRLLARTSTPITKINQQSHFNQFENFVGDKVKFENQYLPQPGGTLGLSSAMEILSKAIDLDTGLLRFELVFTSSSNLRVGVIAPCDAIASITSQSVVNVPVGQGSFYEPGYKIRLYNFSTNTFFADPVNEILSVVGDTLTFVDPWATTLATTTMGFRFADYNDASAAQKSKYAFISKADDTFDDNSKAYQIVV